MNQGFPFDRLPLRRLPDQVNFLRLECLDFSGERVRLLIRCSKGTYIRTLCKDIGQALGCGGCMERLARMVWIRP